MRGQPPVPAAIGRFRIESVLGRGGMGEVYKAFDPTLQRTVAVKTIRPDIDRPEYLERMMREAQACARLSHPNIVTIFEAGQADGVVFIAMEFLQGKNLAEVLETTSLTVEEKIHILAKVLEGLHHAHGVDVVHRDIKPSNVHVQSDGTIKLMDFGLARVLTADTLTASGNVIGTPHYASPEQLKGEPVDRRSDVYSAGVVAYEMLSGRRPFEPDNDSISSVIIKVISETPKPMDTDLSRMLPDIETIVSKAMAKSPADRYQSADDMRRALVAFLETSKARITAIESAAGATVLLRSPASRGSHDSTATLNVPPPAAPSRAPWYWAGGVAAAAGVAAVVALGLPSTSAAPSETAASAPPPAAAASASPTPVTSTPTEPAPAPSAANPSSSAPVKPAEAVAKSAALPSTPAPPAADTVARDVGAKELFSSASANVVAPGLRFRVMVERADGSAADVDPARDFHTGERIRFAFESNVDGYLYVAQQGTSGKWTVLFPHPDVNNGLNAVKRFAELEVPKDNWFQVSGDPGDEQLFVFLSREPLNKLPGFDRPVRDAFGAGSPALVAELSNSIQSRDLILAKDSAASKGRQATYVVNKGELGKAVTAKFTITHKP